MRVTGYFTKAGLIEVIAGIEWSEYKIWVLPQPYFILFVGIHSMYLCNS